MSISIDLSDARKLVHELDRFARHAMPFASRNAINTAAFEGRKEWARQISAKLVLRNTFTVRSLRVEKARGLRIEGMVAVLGSAAPYMGTQESGGTVRGKGKSKPIPTSVAAGQSKGARPRTKQVRKANWLSAIKLVRARGRSKMTRQQRNAMAIRLASKSGNGSRVALLELDNKKRGLFRVTGRKRLTVRMLWNLSHRSVRVPRSSTLERTLKAIEPRMPIIHRDAVLEQLKRHRVLGY
jgi:hypothetical protein